jgi:hypothetical protein
MAAASSHVEAAGVSMPTRGKRVAWLSLRRAAHCKRRGNRTSFGG